MRGRFISVLLRGFHVYAASGNLERIIATAIDLSVVKEAEAKAKQLQDELVHVSSVNAMGAMASTLAHELNQPLTAISNYLGGRSEDHTSELQSLLRISYAVFGLQKKTEEEQVIYRQNTRPTTNT